MERGIVATSLQRVGLALALVPASVVFVEATSDTASVSAQEVCQGGAIYPGTEHDYNNNGILEDGEYRCVYPWDVIYSVPPTPTPVTPRGSMFGVGQERCVDVDFADDGETIFTNTAATEPLGPGYATEHVPGGGWNQFVTVNYTEGQTTSNADILTVNEDRKLCVTSYAPTHAVVDVTAVAEAGAILPVQESGDPLRVIQTNLPNSQTGGKLVEAGGTVCAEVGHPGEYMLATVAADGALKDGFLTVHPSDDTNPGKTASLTFSEDVARSNFVLASVGSDGKICVTPNVATHVFLDSKGYFADGVVVESGTGLALPVRLLDTRTRGYKAAPSEQFCLPAGIPGNYAAFVISATEAEDGFVSATARQEDSWRDHSSGNIERGITSSSWTITEIGEDGRACVATLAAGHIIVELVAQLDGAYFVDGALPEQTRLIDSRDPKQVYAK